MKNQGCGQRSLHIFAIGDPTPVTVMVVISVAQRTYGVEDARATVAQAALVYSSARAGQATQHACRGADSQ